MQATASEHYHAGRLQEAIGAMNEEVRKHPADPDRRGFLAELLCVAGQLERADKQLEALTHQAPETQAGIALLRQLIRAEQWRQQFFAEGRPPELLGRPAEHVRLRLEASIQLREGDAAGAAQLLERAEQQRGPTSGTCNGEPFDDVRDLDDLLAGVLEVLTSTGKYFWVPLEDVEELHFEAPTRPRDLLWRQAHMIVRGGPDGVVYLPATYAAVGAEPDDATLLGRCTDWLGGEGAPVRGLGLRTFLVGEADRTILELGDLVFEAPAA